MSLLLAVQAFEDAATVTFALTPSGSDAVEFVDSDTERLVFTVSATEVAQFVDFNTELLALSASGNDIAQFIDAAIESLKLSPYITEEYPVVRLSLTPSADVEKAGYFDQIGFGLPPNESGLPATRSVSNTVRDAVSFIAPATTKIDSLAVYLRRTGNPTDNAIIELRDDNTDKPGTLIVQKTFPGSSLDTAATRVTIDLDEVSITSGTKYWIVIYREVLDNTNRIEISVTDIPNARPWQGGTYKNTVNSGTTWTTINTPAWPFLVYTAIDTPPYLGLTPSASDTAQFADSATESFKFTPSDTQAFEAIDADTESLSIIPSASDVAEFVDAVESKLTNTPSSTDTAQYTESDTESFLFTPSASEEHTTFDFATELFKLSPSDTQIFESVDANTESFRLTPSATVEKAIFDDILLSDLTLLPNLYSNAVAFSLQDPASDTMDAQSFIVPANGNMLAVGIYAAKHGNPSDTLRIELRTDSSNKPSNTVLATRDISPNELETDLFNYPSMLFFGDIPVTSGDRYWIIFYRTGLVHDGVNFFSVASYNTTFGGSDHYADGNAANSSNGGTFWFTISSRDYPFRVFFESNNVPRASLTPSSTDIADYVDSDTESFSLTPSGTDTYTPGTGTNDYFDSATETLLLTPSVIDLRESADAATEILELTASSTDEAQLTDSDIESLLLSPSASDLFQGSDEASELFVFVPSATENVERTDANTAILLEIPSAIEFLEPTDADTVPLRFTISAYEFYKIYELVASLGELRWRSSITFKRYWTHIDGLIYSGAIAFRRWWSNVGTR